MIFLMEEHHIIGKISEKRIVEELIKVFIAYSAPSKIISIHYATASSSFFAVKSSAQLVFLHKKVAFSLSDCSTQNCSMTLKLLKDWHPNSYDKQLLQSNLVIRTHQLELFQ